MGEPNGFRLQSTLPTYYLHKLNFISQTNQLDSDINWELCWITEQFNPVQFHRLFFPYKMLPHETLTFVT